MSSMIKCFFDLSAYLAGDQSVNQVIRSLDIIQEVRKWFILIL